MSNAILLNNTTPEELTQTILTEVKKEFENLKQHYKPQDPEEWLTRTETSRLLKISLVTLHEYVKKNLLHPYYLGNRTYFSRKQITETLLKSNK